MPKPSEPKVISWHQKEIGILQMEVQVRAVQAAFDRLELEMMIDSPPSVWKIYEGLKAELRAVRQVQKDFLDTPCKPKRFWSGAVVKIYAWATRERFTF